MVEVAQQRLYGVGCFFGMVKRNAANELSVTSMGVGRCLGNTREQVVHNMVLNDTMEQVTTDKTKLSIDRGQGTLDKGPAVSLEVRYLHVSVVKICNGNYKLLAID